MRRRGVADDTICVVGVDPGSHESGIVLRHRGLVLHGELVTNPIRGWVPDAYLNEVVAAVELAREKADDPNTVVAIEGLVKPNPHMGMLAVNGILLTAQVLGAVRAAAAQWVTSGRILRLVVVPPGGNGSGPLTSYPRDLVGAREARGGGKLRHLRSAWDVAGAASSGFAPDLLDLLDPVGA